MTTARSNDDDPSTRPAGERDYLASYDPSGYPSVAVAVDVVLLTLHKGQLSVLLIERAAHPYLGSWALPGGFVRQAETLAAAARRELAEETGVREFAGHLEQLGSYGDPGRDPRMRVVSIAYLAITPDAPRPVAHTDAALARLWPVADLALGPTEDPAAPRLAFDHARILDDAIERARAKLEYSALATAFCDEPFTVADLRRTYEAVWETRLDPANFQRKILATDGLLVPLDERSAPTAGGGRPARLYRRGAAQLLHPPLLRPHADR